ncbi:MAG: hypothetical protein K5905_19050 [Roseibium sp.]|uniref:hypothetical protein n=1 Tax=Roseibium sp. TaxID=1936156 RepID=UPI002612176D|nr:hypothetical protein [Roseibium sp.]MCV0427562.1 hypothetical protein [Roseibium sp.]
MTELKETYRGHEIILSREENLGGWEQLYYSIYRSSDGFECECDFTSDESELSDFMNDMKARVDEELSSKDPWDEKAKYETV